MPPNLKTELFPQHNDAFKKIDVPRAASRTYRVKYFNVLTFSYWNIAGLYGLYLCFTSAKFATVVFAVFMYACSQLGITAGAHRLWTHRAYKAKLPLQIILMILNSISFQNTAVHWIRDHRLHHKYSDTDADPHNAVRGFFYSHVGWLLVDKHPLVRERGKGIDMKDVYANRVLMFQKKYAVPMFGTLCFILPTLIPMYCWNETLSNAWHLNMLRYALSLNAIFLVGSAAHMWGYRPYDRTILPVDSTPVSLATLGEGSHNYHHVFPWDYRTPELGNNRFNITTRFIEFFQIIGWAYDLKTVSDDLIKARARRTGDISNIQTNHKIKYC